MIVGELGTVVRWNRPGQYDWKSSVRFAQEDMALRFALLLAERADNLFIEVTESVRPGGSARIGGDG